MQHPTSASTTRLYLRPEVRSFKALLDKTDRVGKKVPPSLAIGKTDSCGMQKSADFFGDFLPVRLFEISDARGGIGLESRDFCRSHDGRRRQPCPIEIRDRNISGPAPVGGARDHEHPEQTGAPRLRSFGNHQRRSILLYGTACVGKRDPDDVPGPTISHSPVGPLRRPIR